MNTYYIDAWFAEAVVLDEDYYFTTFADYDEYHHDPTTLFVDEFVAYYDVDKISKRVY